MKPGCALAIVGTVAFIGLLPALLAGELWVVLALIALGGVALAVVVALLSLAWSAVKWLAQPVVWTYQHWPEKPAEPTGTRRQLLEEANADYLDQMQAIDRMAVDERIRAAMRQFAAMQLRKKSAEIMQS